MHSASDPGPPTTTNGRWSRREAIERVDVRGSAVLVDVDRGATTSLNAAGVVIWDVLADPVTVAVAADALGTRFAVAASKAAADAAAFVDALAAGGWIERR